jgi:N-sulfoglucosamine sulfohydrolase
MNCVRTLTVTLALLAVSSSTDGRPNILVITSEDNGPELGCYGDPFVRTPNLDQLAAAGVRFERACVATASCSESRAALLTGLYPHQNGQIGLSPYYRMYGEIPNMFSRLHAAGYRTGLIGKLHINPESAFPIDYRPDVKDCNTYARRDVSRVSQLAEEFFRGGSQPFFLMVNYSDAHLPFLRQQHNLPATPLSARDVRPLPWVGLDTPRLRETQADYYNCIMRLDEGVGLLMSKLEAAGLADETLVIYLGDHGAQFPRGKLASYESSVRIPLILRWHGHIRAGGPRSQLVSTIDILPTVLEAADLEVPHDLPGRSLLSLTEDRETGWREYLFAEYHAHVPPIYFPQRTVRDERYKLIVNLLQDRPNPVAAAYTQNEDPPYPSYVTPSEVNTGDERVRRAYATWSDAPQVELYDLASDPHEWRNRADDLELAGVKTRLLQAMEDWQTRMEDPLQDPEKLVKLTAEHAGAVPEYRARRQYQWQYVDYMRPKRMAAVLENR